MGEVWKDINGYRGVYQVSNFGNIRSVDRLDCNKRNRIAGRIIRPGEKGNGYLQVSLVNAEGVRKNHYVHRLVMETFIGKCPDNCEVNHIDEDKKNNNLSNLEYVTHKTNINYGTGINRQVQRHKKAVEQYSINGIFITEYSSTIEAERQTGIWHNNISKVCKNKAKTAGGYVWRYKGEK